jgi:hypothetical protein
METVLNLSIRNRGKGVPYGPVDRGESANRGFKALKRDPRLIAEVAEACDDDVLRNAIMRINAPHTPFFSVGCEKSFNKEIGKEGRETFWAKGYLEFSFNYKETVADACSYFVLFFNFNRAVIDQKFDKPIWFHWELEGAHFFDGDCHGWTCCVWIQTTDCPSENESREVWHAGVDFFATFLEGVEGATLSTIY